MSPASGLPDKIETVLFDAGGVLLDLDYAYLRRLVEACNHTASEAALSRAEARARLEFQRRGSHGGEVWRDYFHLILGTVGVPDAERDEMIDTLWEAHKRVGLWTVAIQGAVAVVEELHGRGLRTGVVSNAEGQVARDLERAGFVEALDTIVDSHVVGVSKPDPEIFRVALRELDMPAQTAVFVGDVPRVDVAGARAAGVAAILLDRHDMYPDEDAPRLRSLKDLPALIYES